MAQMTRDEAREKVEAYCKACQDEAHAMDPPRWSNWDQMSPSEKRMCIEASTRHLPILGIEVT